MSILRNGNVPCRYFSNVSVEFKEVQCRLSNFRKRHVALSIVRVKVPSVRTSEQSRGKEGAEFGFHHSSQNVMSFHMIPHML